MYSTFTGSSRKVRNVNLSGQSSQNPFGVAEWGLGASGSGTSHTVAYAQAERQQRQHERDRLKAAQRLQRCWRGHRARQDLRKFHRQALSQLYEGEDADISMLDADERVSQAVPLVLSTFEASSSEDHRRLILVVQELLRRDFNPFESGKIHSSRLDKLAQLLIAALERLDPCSTVPVQYLLEALEKIVKARPRAAGRDLQLYYRVLAKYCRYEGLDALLVGLIRSIAVAPLDLSNRLEVVHADERLQAAYRDFAFSFLAEPELVLFEQEVAAFAVAVDGERLLEAVLHVTPEDFQTPEAQRQLLWLLSHFIALQRARNEKRLHTRQLRALYMLLSPLANIIRESVMTSVDVVGAKMSEDGSAMSLPPYVSDQLASLTHNNEISGLVEQFTANQSGSLDTEEVGFLAGFTLTMIFCFPPLADEIRMRLFLANTSASVGRISALEFLWNAMSKTTIFSAIASSHDATLDILRQAQSTKSRNGTDTQWHRDWRIILLFLELYVFVLRLTDDDDFFAGMNRSTSTTAATSRLRSTSLSLNALKSLALFLKHLSFRLYHDASEILEAGSDPKSLGSSDDFLSLSQRRKTTEEPSKLAQFAITVGVDFNAFRSLVNTTTRMLYERDSRRPFLPKDHWLMTSKFVMSSFLQAVALEEEGQQALREAVEDGEAESDNDDTRIGRLHSITSVGRRISLQTTTERIQARQKRISRERLLAAMGPKLEILKNMPFVIPFETRVQIFRHFVSADKKRRRGGHVEPDRWRMWLTEQFPHLTNRRDVLGRHYAKIKRGEVFRNALDEFWELGEGLKEPIQITFIDEFGMNEAGIDGGGVTKEFLISVITDAFTRDQRLFTTNSKNSYYPNPCAMDQQKERLKAMGRYENSEEWQSSISDLLKQYEFLGRIIGKCLYEGIQIDIVFAGFFLLKWASAGAPSSFRAESSFRATVNDLHELDEELYQGMMQLKNYSGDVSELGLDFIIEDPISPPGEPVRTVTRNLMPNGDEVAVNNENRPLYINYVARHRVAVQPYQQTRAFLRGLGMIIEPTWLRMFNQSELQRLLGGDSSEIDVEDLRQNTHYGGVYQIGDDGEEHQTVKIFWEVMRGLGDHERRDVLKYVTSTPRAPLLGFAQLRPLFTIRDGGLDEERLPSASTCVNLLKLPQYRSKATLKRKLLYAVTAGAGFDLS